MRLITIKMKCQHRESNPDFKWFRGTENIKVTKWKVNYN